MGAGWTVPSVVIPSHLKSCHPEPPFAVSFRGTLFGVIPSPPLPCHSEPPFFLSFRARRRGISASNSEAGIPRSPLGMTGKEALGMTRQRGLGTTGWRTTGSLATVRDDRLGGGAG